MCGVGAVKSKPVAFLGLPCPRHAKGYLYRDVDKDFIKGSSTGTGKQGAMSGSGRKKMASLTCNSMASLQFRL